ncbi:hypothetical protein [Candidatus Xianfuyuplasma coldseepsis]|uniref:Uncharacterized protein n=1 Tax=Candidatus Xianfuyuplasma coldseepsis TaxID=2782163 RepID=A0A7L7KQ11_9MOLU|nr:hypothetical protein [Xianfuyuplasma coldseepsis]QMS84880.1 hypothetical protein G4Z02_03635 [Xianfuyuplasma coldseepsis]
MNQEPEKNNQNEEELEELREVIKKLEELQKQQNKTPKKRPRRPFIAIEFGGVFHHNRIINFVFSFILNFTFAFFVIEIFDFAVYSDIINMVALMLLYSVVEEFYRTYLLMKHFSLILKSFGTIFFFGYIVIFFVLDQYVFIKTFNFVNGTLLAFFVLIFTLTRYFFGTYLRRFLRRVESR